MNIPMYSAIKVFKINILIDEWLFFHFCWYYDCDDNILLQTLNDPEMYSIGVADVEHSGSKEVGAVESK